MCSPARERADGFQPVRLCDTVRRFLAFADVFDGGDINGISRLVFGCRWVNQRVTFMPSGIGARQSFIVLSRSIVYGFAPCSPCGCRRCLLLRNTSCICDQGLTSQRSAQASWMADNSATTSGFSAATSSVSVRFLTMS